MHYIFFQKKISKNYLREVVQVREKNRELKVEIKIKGKGKRKEIRAFLQYCQIKLINTSNSNPSWTFLDQIWFLNELYIYLYYIFYKMNINLKLCSSLSTSSLCKELSFHGGYLPYRNNLIKHQIIHKNIWLFQLQHYTKTRSNQWVLIFDRTFSKK